MKPNQNEIEEWNSELESMNTHGRIHWAWDRFGLGLLISTSFGLQSLVLIHLVRQVSTKIPIVFIETGYLFPGTYQYGLTLQKQLGFKAHVFTPENLRPIRSPSTESSGSREKMK